MAANPDQYDHRSLGEVGERTLRRV
ncbi:MAG: hypothetical protein JWR58_1242, partial [Pseudonocardia sp.]|nr:hypothetical protein [Pseudonocardia sp.]